MVFGASTVNRFKDFKFESLTQQIGFLCIQRSLSVYLCIGKIIIHRNICDDGCKFFAHHCLIPVFYNIFGCTRWLYHIRMCMNFLNASILSDQRSRCFSPIPGTPGILSAVSPIRAFTSINSFGVT